jgi:hypothetical protein
MKQRKRKIDALAVLLLFAVFAVCVLSVLLSGADVYHRLADRDRLSYDYRTAGQYLSTRVRQADRLGQVSVIDFGGTDALVFTEEIEGENYETLVYCYDGYLRELFALADGDFLPEDGEKVLQAQSLSLSLDGQLLTAELVGPAGEAQELTLFLRSGEEVGP